LTTIRSAFLLTVIIVTVAIMAAIWDRIPAAASEAGSLALLCVRGAGVIVAVVTGVGAWWWVSRHNHEKLRMRDGAWSLLVFNELPITMRVLNWLRGQPSPKTIYDHNNNPTPHAVIYRGVHIPEASIAQYAFAADVEKTNRVRAAIAGDAARSLPWGGGGQHGVYNAATGKYLAGGWDKTPKQIEATPAAAPVDAPVARIWQPADALNTNTRTKWAMGATPTGEIIKWDVNQAPHVRLHGMTQSSGKTNLATTIAAGAARTGAEITVMDRRRFKDWQAFQGCARLIDTRDPKTFAAALHELVTEYQARDAILGQHGAANIAALENPPRRKVIVIAEFGAACATAAADGLLDDVLYPLQLLAREAGATGIHLVVEDQVVDQRWPRGVSTNLEAVTGRLPENYGAAGGYVFAHKLPAYTFHYNGVDFGTWPMAPVLAVLLANVRPVTVDGRVVSSPGSSRAGGGEGYTSEQPVNTVVNSPVNSVPVTVDGWYEWTLDNYFPAHMELLRTENGRGVGIQALADAMAAHNGKDATAMKGTASEVAKRLRTEASIFGGKSLGSDPTNEVQP
jgi:hypothetical protein